MEYRGEKEFRTEFGIDYVEEVRTEQKRVYYCSKCNTIRYYKSRESLLETLDFLVEKETAGQEDD